MVTDLREVEDGFATVAGRRLHYLRAGSGRPLVLLHSNGGSAYEYEEMFPLLVDRFRVIAWDMPGHGDSDPLDRHIGVDDYADAVVGLLDNLKLDKAIVCGASIGGAVCASFAARHAERLLKPIIVECPFRSAEEWRKTWPTTEANYAQTTQSREKIAPRLRSVDDRLLTRWNIDRNKAGTKTMLSVMWALREFDVKASLERIEGEAGLIFGDRSPTVGKLELFRSTLRHSRAIVLSNVGHFPMLDDPPAFQDAIVELAGR